MLDVETLKLIERGVVALERLADKFAPLEDTRERKPAVLGTAAYTREEQNRKELRQTFGSKAEKPQG